jgi:hypothetical protein
MILMKGTPVAFNYTYGPALIYRGPRSIDAIYRQGEPVVVIADMIPMDELRRIELTRVRGFVFSKGTALDEDHYNFLNQEKRAAVIGCELAMEYICEGDMVIVDGVEGLVCLQPNEETLEAFQEQRKKGPPSEKGIAIQKIARAMLDGLVQERAEAEARGEKIMKSGEVISKEEALALSKNQPGLIYQILSGLPLPNSPTADPHGHAPGHEHGHDHGHGEHDHDHEHEGEEEKKPDARARREAQKSGREAKPEAAPATAEASAK